MAIDAEIAKIGASRLSSTGLPVVVATNALGSEDADVEHFGEIDQFGVLGVTARPAAANTNGHAEALVFRGVPGTTGITGLVRDERAADAYAMLSEGDSCLHATGAKHGAMLLTREDGRVTMLTSEDATITGRTVFCEVAAGTTDEPGGNFRVVGPFGKMTMGQNGFHLRHYTGARIDLGGIGGLPSPLDSMGAYVGLSAPIIRLEGGAITLGAGVGSDAVAKSTAVVAALTAAATALTVLAGALPGIGAATVSGAGAGPAGTASAACTAAALAIDAALALIPSTSTTVS